MRAPVEVVFAIPGRLATRTGGYGYDRRVLELAPAHGLAMRHLELPAGFPHPSAAALVETERLLARTPAGAVLLADGLAYGALPAALIGRVNRRIVALVHHPLAMEAGLAEEAQARLVASERAALRLADRVIATSRTTARTLASDFGIPAARLAVAEPGTDPAPRSRGSPPGSPPRLLSVGTIVPRKGYDILVAALEGLADVAWRLDIAGSFDRDAAASRALRAQIAATGLGGRIRLMGEVTGRVLAGAYDRADVFVSSSLYEGYGMALAEALARGLPIVATTGGAAAETVPDDAGLKVPPGNVAALRAALRRVLLEAELRLRLSEGSHGAGEKLPTWTDTTATISEVLHGILA